MSTADEILMMRADAMPKLDALRSHMAGSMAAFAGMRVHVVPDHMKDLLTMPHWKVVKSPIKKRRKGYRVVCERRPCAFVINQDALRLNLGSSFNMRIDF